MLATDLDFDPSYKQQRETARFIIGALLNIANRQMKNMDRDDAGCLKQAEEVAIAAGIIWHDEWKHAPRCPANNWSQQRWATSECNCGAAYHKIRGRG